MRRINGAGLTQYIMLCMENHLKQTTWKESTKQKRSCQSFPLILKTDYKRLKNSDGWNSLAVKTFHVEQVPLFWWWTVIENGSNRKLAPYRPFENQSSGTSYHDRETTFLKKKTFCLWLINSCQLSINKTSIKGIKSQNFSKALVSMLKTLERLHSRQYLPAKRPCDPKLLTTESQLDI